MERRHRDDGHRAALVRGRADHEEGHAGGRRDPPDLRRARAVPGARQARRLPLHLAVGDRGPDVLRGVSERRRGTGDPGVRPRPRGTGEGAAAAPARVPERARHAAGDERTARRGGVRADPGRGRAARPRRGRALAAARHGVLPRRRADPRDPAVPRRGGATAVPARDDGGGTIGAQHPRARHRGDLRRPLCQRRRARPQRADAAVPRRQRNPADGGPGARPRGRRRGLHPQRPRPRVRGAHPRPAGVPARRGRRARRHHVRGAGRGRAGAGPAGAARSPGLPGGDGAPHRARADRERPAHPLWTRRGCDARGASLGRAARTRRRRDRPLRRGRGEHRVAAPHDA